MSGVDLWQGHAPSQWDWQVLAISPTREPHLMQFYRQRYTLDEVIRRADSEANWYGYAAFMVRDTDGTVVHRGPVTNALGFPKRQEAFAKLCEQDRAFAAYTEALEARRAA